jgi:hypothetical protein
LECYEEKFGPRTCDEGATASIRWAKPPRSDPTHGQIDARREPAMSRQLPNPPQFLLIKVFRDALDDDEIDYTLPCMVGNLETRR